ncbi:MAG: fumarylacetoacetate hydrolase family protein [Deltaproteobacteria bacterium]|nr:fumarylacetoacetate hydrolase family protein [Deltaproteobacteria bacterium]MBW2397338.1 fumarylacetoacetate hydrolase family protein [Deltaproteobacteria bacterium]
MRLVTFTHGGRTRLGRLEGGEVVDLRGSSLPSLMLALLEAGSDALAEAGKADGPKLPLEEVRLEAPIARPPKILAVGLNYADHVAETGREIPTVPIIFNKQSTAVVGPFDPFHRPKVSQLLDYEGELAIVIGKRCRHVPKQKAHEVIAGYTVCNDVSVRDWQRRSPTMMMGKSFDTHCPLGPALVTVDELGGTPSGHELRTLVNGELRQHSNTKELIFDCFELVEHLSTAFTLEPGDVISTGTCGGVAAAMKPPKWLVPGDVVRIEIEGIGAIENPVIEEPETLALGPHEEGSPI